MFKRLRSFDNFWPSFLFWSWNTLFLLFFAFGFAPNILPQMVQATRAQAFPPQFLFYALLIVLLPFISFCIGLWWRKEPRKLLALFYVVQAPLMLLIVIRLFFLRQLIAPHIFLFGVAMVGLAAYLTRLFWPNLKANWIRYLALSALLLLTCYLAVWALFFILPLTAFLVGGLIGFVRSLFTYSFWSNWFDWPNWSNWLESWSWMGWAQLPLWVLGNILFIYSLTLFVGLPVVAIRHYYRAWREEGQGLRQKIGSNRPIIFATLLTTILLITLFLLTNRQPQHYAFNRLSQPPISAEQAHTLQTEAPRLKRGLLNAYLARHRYFSADNDLWFIADLWLGALGGYDYRLPEEAQAYRRDLSNQVALLHNRFAIPLYYQSYDKENQKTNWSFFGQDVSEEAVKSAELYQTYFDAPITQGEKEEVVRAVRSTWDVNQSAENWRMVDDREVWMAKQTVTLEEHDNWAKIELHEQYVNQTIQNQEVMYYFNLPETAVLTGLWLGNTPEKSEAFVYRVAPRGAAQQIYQEQVRVRRDPALLEQIGPRQYRLRIFPIPARENRYTKDNVWEIDEGVPLYLWLTYHALPTPDGWPLPQLSYQQNIFWNNESERTIIGRAFTEEAWLPRTIPATTNEPQLSWQRLDFDNGQTLLTRPITPAELPTLSADTRLAVILDRSGSMEPHRAKVAEALQTLQERGFGSADLYLTATSVHGEAARRTTIDNFTPDDLFFFGGQNAIELLIQFDTLRQNQQYDALLVLTDSRGYELGESELNPPSQLPPVWMVHWGGLTYGYDDKTLELIQASGGGAETELEAALQRLAVGLSGERAQRDVVDGYVWEWHETAKLDPTLPMQVNEAMRPFAARRLILAEMVRQRDHLDQLESLDFLHALAVENSIVTPYSSMIVLVNEAQNRRLDELEQQADRFEREHEEIAATDSMLTGVPEPHEYLLMGLGVTFFAYRLWQRRRQRAISWP